MIQPFSLARRSLIIACAALPGVARAAQASIKIALVTSLSGPFTALWESMRAGLNLLLDQQGRQMGGCPVQLLIEDGQGKPDEAVRKIRKLVGQDRVNIIFGVISAAVALAIRDIVIAWAQATPVLLLDEPTAGLSEAEARQVLALVREHHAQTSVVLILYDIDIVFGLCKRVGVLDLGWLIAIGTPAATLADTLADAA